MFFLINYFTVHYFYVAFQRGVQNEPSLYYKNVNEDQSQDSNPFVSRHWPYMVAASVFLALCLSSILVRRNEE